VNEHEREDVGLSALVEHRSGPGEPGSGGRDHDGPDPGGGGLDGAAGSTTRVGPVDGPTRWIQAPFTRGERAASAGYVEQETMFVSGLGSGRQRTEFGQHLEAHYPRLVAQLYAITLDAGEAHEVVQDAYARAWRNWAEIVRSGDPSVWVRRVAVSTTIHSWRSLLARVGLRRRRPPEISTMAPRTAALIGALYRLPPPERRAVVLFHMVGASTAEIAALEGKPERKIESRLSRARLVVTEDMVDVFLGVLGTTGEDDRD
jgi:RNA polymerase sigma-70 factor (ECF subfamily)